MSQLEVRVKFNDGIWWSQEFPQFYNENTFEGWRDCYNMLLEFKNLGNIRDFKLYWLKYDDKGNKYRVDIKDILNDL